MSDSGVDAGSDSNESVCMSLASSISDNENEDNNHPHNAHNAHNHAHHPHHHHNHHSGVDIVDNDNNHNNTTNNNESNYTDNPIPQQIDESLLNEYLSHPSTSSQSLSYSSNYHMFEVSIDRYSYDNEEQHEYCSKIRSNRLKRHELKWKSITRDITGERMLRRAANNNDYDAVKTLLNSGINARSCDERNRTALHFAACKGNTHIARLLLEKGANPNQKDIVGNTPLHLAACTNHIEVITLLLSAGTDINSLDNCGRTPLHLAQSKLKMLQQQSNMSINSNSIKREVLQVVDMMLIYLQRSGKSAEVELLNAFSSRLHLHQTREEVDTDVKDLLTSLTHLTL